METALPPPSKIDLLTILSESRRTIKAHSRHFSTLSLLFLLPLSLSISVYPLINQLFSPTAATTTTTIEYSHLSFLQQNPAIKYLIFILLYTLIISGLSNLATGSITHSVFHGYYGQPVNLASSIKAAFTSFFPLLSTSLVRGFIVYGISLILSLILSLAFLTLVIATQLLGFQVINYPLMFLVLVYAIVLVFILLYLGVNWIFAYVIVVVESSWGAEPLKRSRNLVKGMKMVALKTLVFFSFLSSINAWFSIARTRGSDAHKSMNWALVMNMVVTSYLYMLILLYGLAANTVFYIYCKAQHGEIAEDFAGKYVSLPFDDDDGGKVPRVVSIV